MPLTPTKVRERRTPLAFEYAGEQVHIEYKPTAVGNTSQAEMKAFIARMESAEDEAAQRAILVKFGAWICTILASWDYVESIADDGTLGPMVAITPESMADQLTDYGDFIKTIIIEIFQDYREGNANGTTSPKP